ncbi:hypothetical protein Tco_0918621 [Tanacetum coccineum]
MDTGCRLFLVAGPLFLQFLGASFTQGTVSSIPIVGSISPEGFLPPILLLVVIIVTVVIVAVILVVVVVAIVGVVIVVAIIGVVVVVMIIRVVVVVDVQVILLACSIPIGWAYEFHQDKASLVRIVSIFHCRKLCASRVCGNNVSKLGSYGSLSYAGLLSDV